MPRAKKSTIKKVNPDGDYINWEPRSLKISKSFIDLSLAEEIENETNRNLFFEKLKEEKFNLMIMINSKNDTTTREKFNVFLRRMKILFGLNLYEMIVYLDEEGFKAEKLYKVLNYENLIQIKLEMKKDFNVMNQKEVVDDDFVK